MVTVFGKTLARIADTARAGLQVRPHISIAVVTHRPAAVARNPYKAAAVGEDAVHVVVWQSRLHVQIGHVVALQQSLCQSPFRRSQ